MKITAHEYVNTVTAHLRERRGLPPEHAEIELELATRCVDLLDQNRELRALNAQLAQQLERCKS